MTPASEPEAETPQSFHTLSSIAEREGVSVQYAGKLFRILAQASLVESVRGCKGGYKLSRDPGTIHVGEVLAEVPERAEAVAEGRRLQQRLRLLLRR